jgi:hypothetical protein
VHVLNACTLGRCMCSARVHVYIYILVRNSDSLLLHKAAADLVLCMQRYDHGSVWSSACSFYAGINLCGKLGDTLGVNDLQCGGGALEFSWCCFVISCVAGVNGLRFLLEDGNRNLSRGSAGRAVVIAARVF